MPRRFGFGLGFNVSKLLGAVIPTEPSGFVAKYLSYIVSSMSLVTGNNVEQWDDQSENNNDLTQATSSNQPTFNDDGVSVTQSTLAYQPTLVDTGGGILAVEFDGSLELLDGLHRKSGDISYEIIFKHNNININQYLRGNGDSNAYFYYDGSAFKLAGDGRTSVLSYSATLSTNTTYKVEIIKNGLNVELILDDISLGTQSTSDEFIFDQIGYNTNPQNIDGCVFSFRQWNSADSSGTPDFELLADTQYIPSGVGQPVPTWYATQHNQYANTVNFDATDDNMTPLPTTTGDFAMQFKKKANTLATTKVLFSSSTTSAEVRLNTSNQFEVVSDGGTLYTFPITFADTSQEVNIVRREGDYIYVHGADSYAELAYVAGETFTFDRVSDTANASDSDWQEIRIYDNGLTADEINYFYYLRNENNEILTPPLLPDAGNEFIFSVKTDNAGGVSNNDQMTIGTISTGVYDCTVDWGDGSSDVITTWDDPAWTHTYSVAGTYVITISGTSFTYPYFYNGDDTKVLNVSKWGLTDYGTTAYYSFRGCSNLTLSSSDIPDTSSVTDLTDAWLGCSSLTSFPLLDTSSATNLNAPWFGCSSLTSFPLIDISSVTNMAYAWYTCTSLASFPLLDTSSATNMSYTWYNCSSLASFPLIDTISVTNMQRAWHGCSSLTSFPLLDTSSVTNMDTTWFSCSSLASFPLIDTSSVTTVRYAWYGCSSLTSFPLLDTGLVTNMSNAWNGCSSLTSFPLIDTSSVTDMGYAWDGCSNLTSFSLIDTSSVTNMSFTWRGCTNLTSFPLVDTISVTSMFVTWQNCTSLTSFPLIDTSSVTNMGYAWDGCSNLTSFPLIDTSSVTNMGFTWRGCSSLTSFPLIDTNLVTALQGAWRDCSSLTSFPLIDVSSVTNFSNTWNGCALNSDSIDNIMQALVNGGKSNLSTDISGGTNLGFASWSAGAVANYNTLISRGWTITTNA